MQRSSALDSFQSRIRFHEERNDFLVATLREREFACVFEGTPSVKDAIDEVIGLRLPNWARSWCFAGRIARRRNGEAAYGSSDDASRHGATRSRFA
jgi:hypothetical protein